MKLKAFLSTIFLFAFVCSRAQVSPYTITGAVADSSTADKLEYVAVSVTLADSSHIISSTVTDSAGKFTLTNIPSGKYTITCSFVGYRKKKIAIATNSGNKAIALGMVLLATEGKMLAETVILSEKPVIRFEPGKIVYDVQRTVSDGAETAMESMQKIPGVTVNQDGGVEVRGKSGVTWLVDGKPSPLAQSNPELFLRSIPSKNIESIEVITNPSAKYDAAGTAAVINIHLKKGKLEGLNGSISGGVGTVFDKYNLSGNINYKKDKFNLFANASFRDEYVTHWGIDHRQATTNDSTATYNTFSSGRNHNVNESGKIGMEYSYDKHNSVTYSLDMSGWQNSNYNNRTTQVNDFTTPGLSERKVQDLGNGTGLSETNSLNYRRTYDSTDRTWTIDLAHTWQKNDGNSQSTSLAYDSMMNELSVYDFYNRTHNYGVNQNILLKTDYNTPLKQKDAKIETGFKEEMNLHNTSSDVYDTYSDEQLKDSTQSTVLEYLESITAAYVVYGGKIKSLSYSGGLRWEQTIVYSDKSDVDQNYASLFPSGSLNYRITDKHNISLSYSRRINRAPFWMLNNAVTHNSPYYYYTGNPDLKPSFANSLDLSYNTSVGDQNFYLSTSYSRETGAFTNISYTDADLVTHSTYENAGTNDNFYAGTNLSFKFTKWWNASLWTGYGYHWYEYAENGTIYHNQGGAMNMSGNTTFKFWKTASFQISGWGNTGWVSAQARGKAVCGLTATLKKKFFKDKFIVSLSCRDFLHTQIWRTTNFSPGLYDYNEYHYESTVGYLTLTYQFGKQTFTPDAKDKGDQPEGAAGPGK